MSDAIAKLNVMVSASSAGMVGGMGNAANSVERFAGIADGGRTAASRLDSSIGGANMSFGAMAGAVAVGSAAVKVLEMGLHAATAIASRLADEVVESFDRMGTAADQSDQLGIATEKLMGLQYAAGLAGLDSEQLTQSLTKMQVKLGDAASQGGTTAEALSKIGLNASSLKAMAPEEAFLTIADALGTLENVSDRASIAGDIFGDKMGPKLLPLLMQGAGGIRSAMVEAEKLGVAFTRVDAAKVDDAGDAMSKIGSAVDGVANKLAVQLSPYITAASNDFIEWATSGTTMADRVVQGVEWVASAVASVVDTGNLLMGSWETLKWAGYTVASAIAGGFQIVLDGTAAAVNTMLDGINWAIEKSNEVLGTSFEKLQIRAAADQGWAESRQQLEQQAAAALNAANEYDKAFSRGDASGKVKSFFQGIKDGAQQAAQAVADGAPKTGQGIEDIVAKAEKLKAVTDEVAKIKTAFDQIGMTDAQKKLADLRASGGGVDGTAGAIAQAERLLGLQDQIGKIQGLDAGNPLDTYAAKMEALNELMLKNGEISPEIGQRLADAFAADKLDGIKKAAASIVEEIKSPAEKLQDKLDTAQAALDAGEITQEQFDAYAGKLSSAGRVDTKAPSFMTAGSQESANLIAKFMNRQGSDMGQQQLTTQRRSETHLSRIEKNTAGSGGLQAASM